MGAPKNFLLDLADAVKVESNLMTKLNMADMLGELSIALKTMAEFPNGDNLHNLNGLWSRAVRLKSMAKPDPGITP
jgi:hypothetical protein